MDRKNSLVLIALISVFLFTGATSYKMRHNPQTGRGDWVVADNSLQANILIFTPAGNIEATNIQEAIEELDQEKLSVEIDPLSVHLDQTTAQTVTASPVMNWLTASKTVFTDANKKLTSTGIGTSSQFIKGDGSLDSSSYLTAAITLDSALVSWWRMDDVGTGTVLDYKGVNTATVYGGASQVAGHIGKAYSFDGTGDYLVATSTGVPTGAATRSISLWFNAREFNTAASIDRGTLFSYGVNASGAAVTIFAEDNAVSVAFGNHRVITSKSLLATNTWYHVVLTIPTGATTTANFTLYINGVAQSTTNESGSAQTLNTSSSDIYLGEFLGAGGYEFNGMLDDVMIFNRELTAAEVLEIYQEGVLASASGLDYSYWNSLSAKTGTFNTLNVDNVVGNIKGGGSDGKWFTVPISGAFWDLKSAGTSRISLQGTFPTFSLIDTDGTANKRHAGLYVGGDTFYLSTITDAGGVGATAYSINLGTGDTTFLAAYGTSYMSNYGTSYGETYGDAYGTVYGSINSSDGYIDELSAGSLTFSTSDPEAFGMLNITQSRFLELVSASCTPQYAGAMWHYYDTDLKRFRYFIPAEGQFYKQTYDAIEDEVVFKSVGDKLKGTYYNTNYKENYRFDSIKNTTKLIQSPIMPYSLSKNKIVNSVTGTIEDKPTTGRQTKSTENTSVAF